MKKRQVHWALVIPGILSFVFLLAALILNIMRAAQGDNASAALVGVALPVIIGLGIVIVPVVVLVKRNAERYRRAMVKLQSQYPHVYYTFEFRYGQRLLTADKNAVSLWRAKHKKLEQEVSWPRGTVTIKKASVPISRAVTAAGIVFTDPSGKLRRMAVSDQVAARIEPIDYNTFLPFIM